MRFCISFLAVIGSVVFSLGHSVSDELRAAPGKQIEVKAADAKEVKPPYDYLLFVPKDYDAKKSAWPLIVFLHGAGERGDDLSRVKVHGPPKIVEAKPEFEFIVVSPQVPTGQRWEAEKVIEIVDQVSKALRVDQDRIYLTGLSMGGFGTWNTAAKYPDRFAAIVPICGGGNPDSAEKIKDIPCWVFHGAKDNAVPLKQSEEMVAALKKAGSEPKFTVYPDAGHDSWTESYNNPELFKWLLEQKRKAK